MPGLLDRTETAMGEKEPLLKQGISTKTQLYWNTLLKIPSQVVSFVISILVARILVPNDFGIMGIAMMLIGYANLFTNFGLAEAIVQKSIEDRKTLNSIFTFNLSISIALAIIFYCSSGFIAAFFNSKECENVIKVLSLAFIISAFTAVPSAILRRDMNFKTLSLTELSGSLMMSLVTFGLAWKQFGYWALAFGQLIPSIFVTAFLCFRVRWVPSLMYHHATMKDIYNFGMWNFFKTQLGFISQHTDRFIAGRWLGTASLGFYDKALTTSEMPYNSIAMNINGVMFSSFSQNKGDIKQLQHLFNKSLTLLGFLNFPLYLGLIVITPHFVNSLLGEKWVPMVIPMQIILFSCLFKTFTGLTASLNIGIGKYKEHTKRFFVAAIAFLIACLLLLQFAIIGIAIGYFIFMLLQLILGMNLSLNNIRLSWKDVWRATCSATISSTVMFIFIQSLAYFILNQYTFANLIYLVVGGISSFGLFMLLDNSNQSREIKIVALKDIKNKLNAIFAK